MCIRIVLVGVVLALSLSLWPANKMRLLDIRPGLWQTTVITTNSDELVLPAEMLNRLTPEQRARLEARREADSGKTRTRTYKRCLTRKQLANPDFTKDAQCTWTTLLSTGTRIKESVLCNYKDFGRKLRGSGEFVALDREHVNGSVHMSASGSGRAMDTTSNFSSKWLGSRCGKVK